MHHGNCSCGHHWAEKIMAALVWVAGVLFFWTSLKAVPVWGFESLYYAWVVVILSLMSYSMKSCGCCGGWGKMGMMSGKMDSKMCSHEEGCKCGDCGRCK